MNKPVSFDLAKSLKEKGFNESCSQYYICQFNDHFKDIDGKLYICECKNEDGYVIGIYKRNNLIGQPHILMAPIISDVVTWLYEKHKIWISVQQEYVDSLDFSYRLKEKDGLTPPIGCYKTPTEAYEKAIEYVLKNLI